MKQKINARERESISEYDFGAGVMIKYVTLQEKGSGGWEKVKGTAGRDRAFLYIEGENIGQLN